MHSLDRRSLLAGSLALPLLATGAAPALAAPSRGTGRIASVAYIEVNRNSLENVGHYVLDDGSPAFDMAMIFAANIHHDGTDAVLYCNENVQRVLDDAKRTIRPLQRQGTKVLLSILGDHQGVGLANFPDRAAADRFARSVAQLVHRYGLDGVDLDDEWAEYGKNGTGQPNAGSFVWFVQALRRRLPNKLITFYVIGPVAERQEYEGVQVGKLIDYAWNPYYGSYRVYPVPGLPRDRYGAAAVDLSAGTGLSRISDYATRTKADGFGAFVTYELQPGNHADQVSAFTQPLYGSAATYR